MDKSTAKRLLLTIAKQHPELLPMLAISGKRLAVYNYCKGCDSGVASSKIASHFLMSVQQASMTLCFLYDLNYLDRYEVPSKSGGIEFVYVA